MKLEWWVVFYLEPNRQVMHWISKQKSVSKDEESECAGCLLLLFISRLMNNNKNILKNLNQSEGRRMCKYILFCALIRLFLKSRSACHQVFYVDVFSKHLLNLILFVSFLLATAGACFILQVPLRQLMSSTGKGSPKSCHLSSSPSSSSLQTSTTIWSSMSFLLLLLHHVKDAAADVVRTPQQHHVETFVGWYVCPKPITDIFAGLQNVCLELDSYGTMACERCMVLLEVCFDACLHFTKPKWHIWQTCFGGSLKTKCAKSDVL